MFKKILTENEFISYWLKTGKTPDGNDLIEITIGTKNDAYNQYLVKELKNIQTKSTNVDEVVLHKRNKYIWRTMDDDKVRESHSERDDEVFDWDDEEDIKPGEEYNCRCYAEFLDDNGKPTGEYGRMAWQEKETENDPKPYYEPCDKNGTPLNQKDWKDLTNKEKQLRKEEELDKFKNSDRLKENIRKAQEMKEKLPLWKRLKWFRDQVRSGGPWDYKKNGHPEMEHVGNFNYGATGSALGISEYILESFAGAYQMASHTSESGYGIPFIEPPYGDDPIDQYYINKGIEWYGSNY